jgi:hypothetical protein
MDLDWGKLGVDVFIWISFLIIYLMVSPSVNSSSAVKSEVSFMRGSLFLSAIS